jgi:hypothetical protein
MSLPHRANVHVATDNIIPPFSAHWRRLQISTFQKAVFWADEIGRQFENRLDTCKLLCNLYHVRHMKTVKRIDLHALAG